MVEYRIVAKKVNGYHYYKIQKFYTYTQDATQVTTNYWKDYSEIICNYKDAILELNLILNKDEIDKKEGWIDLSTKTTDNNG